MAEDQTEDALTRIARLRDEEYETACLILARVERIDETLIRINEDLRATVGDLEGRVRDGKRRQN